jgi:hypothetical protein
MVARGLENLIRRDMQGEESVTRMGQHSRAGPPAKKPKFDLTESRPAWVKGTITFFIIIFSPFLSFSSLSPSLLLIHDNLVWIRILLFSSSTFKTPTKK